VRKDQRFKGSEIRCKAYEDLAQLCEYKKGVTIMAKSTEPKKEEKKKPTKTLKEKRAAKKEKKSSK
jgi:hypothetical protein